MNYNYINGLIILDSYYTSISFKISSSYSIIKNPNLRMITINFVIGMKASDIDQYECIDDIYLREEYALLDNNYVKINDSIYYFKNKYN